MESIFRTSYRSPYFLLKRLQAAHIKKHGAALTGRCLDLGCGSSPYREHIRCDQYIGMEMTRQHRAQVIGRGERLPFGSGTMDSLVATEVLEHIADFHLCINEMNRVLKPRGMAYITVPMTWPLHYEPHDYYRFTCHGIKHVLEKGRFRVLSTEKIGGLFVSVGSQLSRAVFRALAARFKFLGDRNAERIGTLFVIPLNIIFSALSLLDRFEPESATCWAVLAAKVDQANPS